MVSEMKTSGGMVSGWVSITQEILERFITSFFPTEMKNEVSIHTIYKKSNV